MKKILKKLLSKISLFSLLLLFLTVAINGFSTTVQAQYYTSASTESVSQSFYSVEKYSSQIPELQKLISIDRTEVPIRKVLEDIVAKADLGIAYNPNLNSLKRPISINLDLVTTAAALKKVLDETQYEATISSTREILLRERIPSTKLKVPIQQNISGTVTDAKSGKTMPGVNITVASDPSTGTSTTEGGEYNISVPDNADSLSFSFIGYQKKTVAVNGRSVINVKLSPQVKGLEDVVVTALGITRKERSIGYSTQEVNGEDLSVAQDQSTIGSLTGKIAGVQISGSSGASMGGTQSIKIRGVNSLSGEGQPLIVVDGTPISNQNFSGDEGADFGNLAQDINPNDIKSVDVLKGPAASALYGIRGQFGVLMITTKSGADVKGFKVEVNSSFEMQNVYNVFEFQNKYGGGSSQTFGTLPNGDPHVSFSTDQSWGPRMDGTMVRQYYSMYPQDPRYGKLTPFNPHPNNVKNYYKTGFKSNQGITLSGGSKKSTYSLSFSDSRTKGVNPNTMHQRDNLGLSTNIDLNKEWTFSANVNYARNKGRRPPQGYGDGSRYFKQWFQRNVSMKDLKNYKYADGTVKQWNIFTPSAGKTPDGAYWDNPYFLANDGPTVDSRNRIFGDFGIKYDVLPQLSVNATVRGDIYAQNIDFKTPVGVGGIVGPSGYTVGKYENREMNYELTAQYTESWNAFSLDATLGTNLYDRNYSYLRQATVGGLSTPGYYNIDASIDRPDNTSYKLEKKIYSFYGLASLGYNDTYFVDLSLRHDKSSTLPQSNNAYWYPSVSGSFVFSEIVNWEPLSFGKLRLSYAKAGSDLSPYQTEQSFGIGTVYNGTNTLTVPNNLNNTNIKPSFSRSYEGGIDLKFFGRLGLSFTYYKQKNKNQIIPLDISGTSGYNSAIVNAGLIENKGIEVELSGSPIQTKAFTWNSDLNLGRNRNKVVRLAPDIDVYTHDSHSYSGVSSYLNSYEGEAYGRLVGQAYQRDEDTGKILLDKNNMPMWTDATHDFGSAFPNLTGGFQNNFRFNNFSLGTMITFQSGGQFFDWTRMLSHKTGLAKETAAVNDKGNNVRDPVSSGGGVKVNGISNSTGKEVTAYVNAQSYYNNVLGTEVYEEWVTDASYIKLSEVKLGYTFDKSTISTLPLHSVKISIYARNPIMIWQAAPQGVNPSELSTGSRDITWTQTGQLSTVRTFGLNLNLTF